MDLIYKHEIYRDASGWRETIDEISYYWDQRTKSIFKKMQTSDDNPYKGTSKVISTSEEQVTLESCPIEVKNALIKNGLLDGEDY